MGPSGVIMMQTTIIIVVVMRFRQTVKTQQVAGLQQVFSRVRFRSTRVFRKCKTYSKPSFSRLFS